MKRACILLIGTLTFAAPAAGQLPPWLCDFSRVQHKPGEVTTADKQKVPVGTVELVDGQFGKACKFSFVAATGPQFFTAWVNPSEDWDQYEREAGLLGRAADHVDRLLLGSGGKWQAGHVVLRQRPPRA